MGNQRVIYDSEEEDEGLSPLNSPAKNGTLGDLLAAQLEEDNDLQRKGQQVGGSRSTDPEFFKRIYEEQQKTPNTGRALDSMRKNEAQEQHKSDLEAKTNSSSITDPTLKSVKKGGLGKVAPKDLGDLTQVTTPSAPRARKRDLYEFTLSDEEGAPAETVISRHKRQAAGPMVKRQRGQSTDIDGVMAIAAPKLSVDNHALDHEEEPPKQSRKKQRNAQNDASRHVPDDVDLLVMSATADMSQGPEQTYGGSDGVIPETIDLQGASEELVPAHFFIEPPDALTSSQKQEYLRVSGCSEHEGEEDEQQASLPVSKPVQTQGPLPTSASLSTIAYTTPSRYASSIAPLPMIETVDGDSSNAATSSARRTQLVKSQVPTSSPDELSTHVTDRKDRRKRLVSDVQYEDELAQHHHWDSDKIGHSRETYVPRASPRRSRVNPEEAGTSSTKGKRQKRGKQDETAHEGYRDADETGSVKERYVPRPSKKRSRAVAENDEVSQHPEQSMPDTCPPGDGSHELLQNTSPLLGQRLLPQPADDMDGVEGVDPDFWAALPEDIRQEFRSQQVSQVASRSRRSGRTGEELSSLNAVQEEMPQPKKRGRKRKDQKAEEAPAAIEEPAGALEEPEAGRNTAPTATAKKRRGRPKKTEAVQLPSASPDDETAPGTKMPNNDLPETTEEPLAADDLVKAPPAEDVETPRLAKAPAKRGRQKKVVEEPPMQSIDEELSNHGHVEDDDQARGMDEGVKESALSPADPSMASQDRQALRDISNTASNASEAGKANESKDVALEEETANMQQEVTSEPRATEVTKCASTPGPQGKAPLRVGLSKKSRIPSLLKIIRK
ncbi:unnamed protein product [Discula destructiva]